MRRMRAQRAKRTPCASQRGVRTASFGSKAKQFARVRGVHVRSVRACCACAGACACCVRAGACARCVRARAACVRALRVRMGRAPRIGLRLGRWALEERREHPQVRRTHNVALRKREERASGMQEAQRRKAARGALAPAKGRAR
eukprot:1084346-Pleurochrysis_carterae.AAC.1